MFAAIAGDNNPNSGEILAMSQGLPHTGKPMATWCDGRGFAVVSRALDILPEDRFEQQPFVDEELAFICRARLDRRDDLLEALEIDGASGACLSDAELMRRAFRRWGQETPQHIYGDFAFVAWQRTTTSVVAASDHLGAVPLFYCLQGARLLVSTQISALLAHPSLRPKLDVRALGLLAAGKMGEGWTMFEGIEHLTGGHILTFDHGNAIRRRRWWRPESGGRTSARREQDFVVETRTLLEAAVATRLRSTGGVAATMSGGLDSTLVTAIAACQLASKQQSLDAFTAVPEPGMPVDRQRGWDASDTPWAIAVARRHRNLRHHVVEPGGLCPLDVLPALRAVSCTPFRNTANIVWVSKISAMASDRGNRVVLHGEHGNLGLSQAGSVEDADLLTRTSAWARLALKRMLRPFVPGMAGAAAGRARSLRTGSVILKPEFCRIWHDQLLRMEVPQSARELLIAAVTLPNRAAAPDHLALRGVDWRDPTADRRLLEHLLQLPLHAFRAGGRSRGLAREIGRGILPESVRLRRTRGLQSPEQAGWFARKPELYRRVSAAVEQSATCQLFLDMAQIRAMRDRLCGGTGSMDDAIFLHRALDVGSFVVSFEQGVLTRPEDLPGSFERFALAERS